ncbi:MAG: hypothetical protein K8F58_19840 [Bauldia sp.]|nr:hypothetical protein [Bauldia sp.]
MPLAYHAPASYRARNLVSSCPDHDRLSRIGAQAHPEVPAVPPAHAIFLDFGARSLDFEVDCFIVDTTAQFGRFRPPFRHLEGATEGGIEIPFPQQDINLRDWPKIEAAVLRLLGKVADVGPTSTRQSREPSS